MLIIHGIDDEDLLNEYLPNNIRSIRITTPNRYGTHHTCVFSSSFHISIFFKFHN